MSRTPLAVTAVLVTLALAPGCAHPGADASIDITHDACAPLVLVPTAATDAQRAGVTAALTLWRARGVSPLVVDTPVAGAPVLELRFEAAAPAFHGAYDDEAGVIYVNAALTSPSALAIVIAHELGHAFGLPHVTERASLMNPGNLALPPTADDQAALAALWGACGAPLAGPPVVAAPSR